MLSVALLTPLPAIGAIRAANTTTSPGAITIYRDHYGVPHIVANTLQGAAYGLGYITARDRLFELDVIRKLGQGRLSELEGPALLPADEYVRREYLLTANIAAQYNALSPVEKSLFAAYADGVNRGAAETLADPATTPSLFAALGDSWEPWTPQDSVVVDMVFTEVEFGGEGAGGELANADLLASLEHRLGTREGVKAFNDLVPVSYRDAPAVIAPGEGPKPPPNGTGYNPTGPSPAQQRLISLPGLRQAAAQEQSQLTTVRTLLRRYRIPVPRIGSYAALLSGRRTASGGGLLLGSPQSGLYAPPIFYEVGVHVAGSTDCEGFTVAGLGPALGIGWCNQHAWTLVAGNMGDQADLYAERLDPRDPHRYYYAGRWRAMTPISTTYLIKGTVGCNPGPCVPQRITRTYWYTVHGPVSAVDSRDHIAFAYHRTQTGRFLSSIAAAVGWNLSKDARHFLAASTALTATYNLEYADAAGNIAYRFTGLQPVRAGTDRRFPVPGSGGAEWHGFLTACQLPHVFDPTSGYLAVNQGTESKPIDWWPDASNVGIGATSRIGEDQRLLGQLRHATLATLVRLNRSYLQGVDPYAALFYPLFAHALRTSAPKLRAALRLLDAWRADGFRRSNHLRAGFEDHPGLAIFELDNIDYEPPYAGFATPLGDQLIHAILGPLTGGSPPGPYTQQLSTVFDALTGHTQHRFVTNPDATIRAAVAVVLAELAHHYRTTRMPDWHQPWPHEDFTGIEPVAPPAVAGMDHGTYSQIVDPRAGLGMNVEPPGNVAADSAVAVLEIEAGNPPPHWADQRLLYQNYGFKPMLMRAAQYTARPEEIIHLDIGTKYGAATTLPLPAPSAGTACLYT